MDFLYQGYPIKFIQKEQCKDTSAHIETYIFKFFSPVTKLHYIIRAEYHEEDVFGIKFYCKKDRSSDFKYSKIVNKGDFGNIVMSCFKVIPYLLQIFPTASFGIIGARGFDAKFNLYEQIEFTQRYKIWSYIIQKKVGQAFFSHYQYPSISAYLLINKTSNVKEFEKEALIRQMFVKTYQEITDIFS